MSNKIQEIIRGHETMGREDSLNIAPEDTCNPSLGTQNDVEVDRENLLGKTCEQAYFDCLDGGSYGLYWANRSEDSGATPTASCLSEASGYLDHSEPHLPFQKLKHPSHSIIHGDTRLAQAIDEKGKGRMVVTELEPEAIIWDSDQETSFEENREDSGGLTREEKDEQSRHDAELSLLLLAQELLEQGIPQEEVASYVFQTQLLAMPPNLVPPLASPFHSTKSSSHHHVEEKPDLGRIAQLTVDGVAKRSLPAAYGPHYSPEPSTSQAGSPILAVRRLSISSTTSSVSSTSTSSSTPSSSYTLEEEEELVAKMQQFLDERYEANKVAILCDLDKEVQKKQKPDQTNYSRRWDMWRQRFGLGLVGGLDEKWTLGAPQYHNRLSLPSSPLDLPDDVRFVQGGGHSCGRGHNDQGSAARTPQEPTLRRGPDQFPISYFAGNSNVYNIQGLGTRSG